MQVVPCAEDPGGQPLRQPGTGGRGQVAVWPPAEGRRVCCLHTEAPRGRRPSPLRTWLPPLRISYLELPRWPRPYARGHRVCAVLAPRRPQSRGFPEWHDDLTLASGADVRSPTSHRCLLDGSAAHRARLSLSALHLKMILEGPLAAIQVYEGHLGRTPQFQPPL